MLFVVHIVGFSFSAGRAFLFRQEEKSPLTGRFSGNEKRKVTSEKRTSRKAKAFPALAAFFRGQ
jgi:hypothetical protein